MRIAVRLDDITPDIDWERFLKFKALLDQYQVKPLIGVVPDNRDDHLIKKEQNESKDRIPQDFWAYVRQLQKEGWVVAMHGYRHLYSTQKGGIFPLNNFSEFAGVPFDNQKEMLIKGKEVLKAKGIETDIFMAPAHSYDNNTLRALKEAGFRALTDGFGTSPYYWKEIVFYPISFQLSSTFRKRNGYSTMVVHTDTISNENLKHYEEYFRREDVKWISYGEYLEQPIKRRNYFGRIREYAMAKGKFILMKLR